MFIMIIIMKMSFYLLETSLLARNKNRFYLLHTLLIFVQHLLLAAVNHILKITLKSMIFFLQKSRKKKVVILNNGY